MWWWLALILLDLSAAFDTTDYEAMLTRLETLLDKSGEAQVWFLSYFNKQTHRVLLGKTSSKSTSPATGIPQGSVAGP